MSLPDYNFLSAPLWLITSLHILTLSLHFAAMNFLVGGIIIIVWGKFKNRWDDPTVQLFVQLFPSAVAATVTLGVAPLLFLQLVNHRQVYSASIVSGWFWLLVIPAMIAGYYLMYGAAFSKKGSGSGKAVWLTIALMLFLYVSIVYSSVFSMAERPDEIKRLYAEDQSGLQFNPEVGDYLLRWLHMIFGAITVGGFFVGLLGRNNEQAFRVGKGFFLWGMIFASVVGTAYLLSLDEYLRGFMRSPAIWSLTVGILLFSGAIHFFFKRRFLPSSIMLFTSLVTMVINRHYVRLLKLGGQFEPSSLPVSPQWSVFAMFLVCFIAAMGAVWYMLRLYFREKPVG